MQHRPYGERDRGGYIMIVQIVVYLNADTDGKECFTYRRRICRREYDALAGPPRLGLDRPQGRRSEAPAARRREVAERLWHSSQPILPPAPPHCPLAKKRVVNDYGQFALDYSRVVRIYR